MEGAEDARVIPELVEANGIFWEESKQQPIVDIQVFDGIENLLAPNVIYLFAVNIFHRHKAMPQHINGYLCLFQDNIT